MIKHHHHTDLLLITSLNTGHPIISDTMTFGEPDPNTNLNPYPDHNILDWLEDSISYLPSFLDDPYSSIDDPWWVPGQDLYPLELIRSDNALTSTSINNSAVSSTVTSQTDLIVSNSDQPVTVSDESKKRKASPDDHPAPRTAARKNQNRGEANEQVTAAPGSKRGNGNNKKGKSTVSNCNNGNNKDGRWAEQLLNPCAAAITAGNVTRVQHLLFVLHELASPTGDANYRLASHGLIALTQHLSASSGNNNTAAAADPAKNFPADRVINFSTAKPKFFQQSLINFNDINPWFTIPNNIANNSILQVLSELGRSRTLHVIDIGVSHGVQWPTLLEALSRRPGGPPPLVRLTVIPPTEDTTPFANGPPGYNFSAKLLRFAKDINVNLQINRIENCPLQNLNAQVINSSPGETIMVCAQFRLHHLSHHNPDSRTGFLKALRDLEPSGVVLSENNVDCSCNSCGDFATGFSRRVEWLWSFLDSTSSAFKGRESEERRMMEGEAAKGLTNASEMNEKRERWGERMRGVGFVGEAFGEDVTDGARALLRKYDSNWEMRVEEKDGSVGLWWKGQPVSFCSLWRIDGRESS